MSKVTQRENQRRTFVDSLYKELDKLSSAFEAENETLLAKASTLIFEDKLSNDMAVDLLIIDGIGSKEARQCVNTLCASKLSSSSDTKQFDYSFSDHRGRIFSGRELGNLVEAENEEKAEVIAGDILSSFDPPVQLLSVTELS